MDFRRDLAAHEQNCIEITWFTHESSKEMERTRRIVSYTKGRKERDMKRLEHPRGRWQSSDGWRLW